MKNNLTVSIIVRVTILFVLLTMFCLSCSVNAPNSIIESFYNYPNPFDNMSTGTTFNVLLKNGEITFAKVDIYSKSGELVDSKTLFIDEINRKSATCTWSGIDKNGKYLPSSIYISKLILKDNKDATYIEEVSTLIN